jgi:hypothetical protein
VILVDTTVLMHATGEDHPLREPSRQVLTAQLHSRLDFAVTVEVLQEFCHARARRRGRDEAVANTRQFAILFRVLETSADDLEHGLEVFRAQPSWGRSTQCWLVWRSREGRPRWFQRIKASARCRTWPGSSRALQNSTGYSAEARRLSRPAPEVSRTCRLTSRAAAA